MNYKFLLFIFSVSLFFGCDDEQAAGPGQADTYIKFFGGDHADIAYQAKQTSDGGAILLGTTEIDNEGVPVSKIKVIKVDKNGNQEWQKIYPEYLGGDNLDFEVSLTGRSIIVVADGYIIVGDSIKSDLSTNSSLFMMKISNSASDNSYQHLAIDYQNNNGEANADLSLHGIDVIQDSQGAIRVISTVTDKDDNIVGTWFNEVSYSNQTMTFDIAQNCFYDIVDQIDLVKSLHETNDGNFIFGGTNKGLDKENAILRKIPACSQTISGASSNIVSNAENLYNAQQVIAANFGFAMIGTTTLASNRKLSVFLALLNNDGTVRDNYPIILSDQGGLDAAFPGIGPSTGLNARDEEGFTIASTMDGGFIIGGMTLSETAGEEDILLIKTDALGNIQWSKTLGNTNQETATYIQQAADGGYLIFGNTEFGGIDTMVLIKTDKNGDIN